MLTTAFMTRSGAISQFAHRLAMLIRIEVVGMASRTVRLVTRESPRDCLRVAGMAVITSRADAMITRVSRDARMTKDDRRPAISVVALVAFKRGLEVVAGHAGCGVAIVAT